MDNYTKLPHICINMLASDVEGVPVVEGYCMTCKKYGVIQNLEMVKMKNGRTRAKGNCSYEGCSGKISKIVS